MRFALFAVLLSIMQAAPPVPRQASNNSSSRGQNVQKDSADKQAPSIAPPVQNTTTPPKDPRCGDTPSKTNAQESVVIRELPPVTANTNPDWWNRAYVILTGLLVVIGGLGVCFAVRTLRAIERQADAMMDADAAFLIIVWENFVHLNPETREQGKPGHALNWTVKNIGKTPAFIKEVACRFIPISSFGDLPLEPQYPNPRDLETEIEPLLAGGTLERWVYATLETALSFNEMDEKVRKKEVLLYGFGYVKYLDIYGREQETRFGLVYECRPKPTMAEDKLVMAGPQSYNRYKAFQKKK